MTDTREMFAEISTLLGNLSKALEMEPEDVGRLLEEGALSLSFGEDEAGEKFVVATHGEGDARRVARIYRDRIYHLGAAPSAGSGDPASGA
ncbi:hypothetical protein [Roseospira navarrensis]|uniref:Uncharacterized protein n=1 Tax=Roseospira navarrensis TaxID=140058 RepID=A0A7X1ZG89_9PROT|nr:hypothetical protein [Roseospira navarrensis]MQX37910.1 hypothetical protein [Roseospira navarrensis]